MNKRSKTTVMILLILLSLLAPMPAAAAKGVVLNFSDVDISTMVKFISDLTGKNFVMDDRVKGKISIFSPSKLTPDEAFNVFTSVLELKGFTLTRVGKVYKIIPIAAARQTGMNILSDQERGPVNDMYVARVIALDHISAPEAVAFLQPVVSKDGYISAFGPGNMVLVVDSSINIQKILGIIQLIDTDQRREKPEIIFLKNAAADSVAKVVQEWLKSRDKSSKPAAQPTAGGIIIPDTRLNALIVFGSENDKEEVKKFVAMLDVASPSTSSKVNVYYLENADATDVAKVLDGVVKGSIAPTPAQPGAGVAAQQQSPFEGGKITITADKATNSLVIMASPTDYQNLLQVIQKLDKRRRQVFVEAMIAEVSLGKLKDLGVQWGVAGGASDGTVTGVVAFDPQGVFTNSDLTAIIGSLKTAGITIPDLGGTAVNFAAVLKALQSNNIVNILSTPTIMTSDNKEAMINVGQNVPLLTTSTVIAGGASQQSLERKDVGITLKITPQISEGEYVKLDIDQEITAVTQNKGQATDIVLSTRKAKTSIVVKDKETVVIGGLIQDQDTETESKIPLFGDIPGLGWLFKTKHKERTKTNLLIVLTPRIIRGAQEMSEVSSFQKQKFGDAIRMDQPFSLDREMQLKP